MNKLSEQQIQKLIDFVQSRPGLYDKRDSSYKEREWKGKCWKEIASNLCADDKDCKDAWRSLRDQFIKRQKQLKGKTVHESEKYKYFKRLLFLKDCIDLKYKHGEWSTNNQELNFSEIDVLELPFNESSTTETVTVPYISAMSEITSNNLGKKRKICPHSETYSDFEECPSTSYSIPPVPEASQSEDNEIIDFCFEANSSSSSKKKKLENMKETFSGFLEKFANTIATKEPDNIDTFFQSIAKSAKCFNFTHIEQLKLMMGTTELLNKIVCDRNN